MLFQLIGMGIGLNFLARSMNCMGRSMERNYKMSYPERQYNTYPKYQNQYRKPKSYQTYSRKPRTYSYKKRNDYWKINKNF